MQKFEKPTLFKNNTSVIVIGVIISALVTVAFVAIFALLMVLFELDPMYSGVLATLSMIIGSLFGGFFAAYKLKSKGLLYGAINGLILFIVSVLSGLIFSSDSLTFNTLFHILGCVLSGAIGGIFAVNKVSKDKFVKGKFK